MAPRYDFCVKRVVKGAFWCEVSVAKALPRGQCGAEPAFLPVFLCAGEASGHREASSQCQSLLGAIAPWEPPLCDGVRLSHARRGVAAVVAP